MSGARRAGARLRLLVTHECRLVLRYGILGAVAVVTVLWLLVLHQLSAELRGMAAAWVVLLDSGIVGLYFVGALVLFERDEATLAAWAVAPVAVTARLLARVGVLTALALGASAAVAFGTAAPAEPLRFLAGVMLLAATSTLAGIVVAAPFRAFLDYVTLSPVALTPLSLPYVLHAVGLRSDLLQVLPAYGPVTLVLGGWQGDAAGDPWLSLLSATAWLVVLTRVALFAHERWLRQVELPALRVALRHAAVRRPGRAGP